MQQPEPKERSTGFSYFLVYFGLEKENKLLAAVTHNTATVCICQQELKPVKPHQTGSKTEHLEQLPDCVMVRPTATRGTWTALYWACG
jgi:hypothetical protein